MGRSLPPNRTFVTQEGNKSGKDEAVSAVSRTRQRERERERERERGEVEEGAMTMGTTYHRTPMKSKGSGKESAKKANLGKSTQR